MIDFAPFCSKEPLRPYFHKPFTLGKFSYATNGHVMIRVPKLADAAKLDKAPNAEKLFVEAGEPECAPLAELSIPPALPERDCEICDGRGREHDCPECECDCDECDGTGRILPREKLAIMIGGVPFGPRYIRLLLTLPGIRVARTPVEKRMMAFEFEGGRGLLMPLNSLVEGDEVIVASFADNAAPASEASPRGEPT